MRIDRRRLIPWLDRPRCAASQHDHGTHGLVQLVKRYRSTALSCDNPMLLLTSNNSDFFAILEA